MQLWFATCANPSKLVSHDIIVNPLESSHFQLVFGNLLSSVFDGLCYHSFSCTSHWPPVLVNWVVIWGILWWHRIFRIDPKNLNPAHAGSFGGICWETWRLNRAVSCHFIDIVASFRYIPVQSKVYQLYQSIGVLDWLVPDTKVWAQLPPLPLAIYLWRGIRWIGCDPSNQIFAPKKFSKSSQGQTIRSTFTWRVSKPLTVTTISYTKNANPFNMETLQNKSWFWVKKLNKNITIPWSKPSGRSLVLIFTSVIFDPPVSATLQVVTCTTNNSPVPRPDSSPAVCTPFEKKVA